MGETELILVSLLCGGLSCLTVAAALLVGVAVVLRSQSSEPEAPRAVPEASPLSDGPELGSIGRVAPPSQEPGLSAEPPGAEQVPAGPGRKAPGRGYPRSSGQTIIAFDDDDDH